jgi:hypothetical protein
MVSIVRTRAQDVRERPQVFGCDQREEKYLKRVTTIQ